MTTATTNTPLSPTTQDAVTSTVLVIAVAPGVVVLIVRRVVAGTGSGYGDDRDRAKTIILQTVQNVAGVLADKPPKALSSTSPPPASISGSGGGRSRRADATS